MVYTVNFDSGQSVDFEKPPTPQDIEEVSKSFAPAPAPKTNLQKLGGAAQSVLNAPTDAAGGMMKGFGENLRGALQSSPLAPGGRYNTIGGTKANNYTDGLNTENGMSDAAGLTPGNLKSRNGMELGGKVLGMLAPLPGIGEAAAPKVAQTVRGAVSDASGAVREATSVPYKAVQKFINPNFSDIYGGASTKITKAAIGNAYEDATITTKLGEKITPDMTLEKLHTQPQVIKDANGQYKLDTTHWTMETDARLQQMGAQTAAEVKTLPGVVEANTLKQDVLSSINSDRTLSNTARTSAVKTAFTKLMAEYAGDGEKLSYSKLYGMFQGANSESSLFYRQAARGVASRITADESQAYAKLAEIIRKKLVEASPALDDALQQQRQLIQAGNYAAKLHGTSIGGSLYGMRGGIDLLAGGIGNALGGPVGGIAGAYATDMLQGSALTNKFANIATEGVKEGRAQGTVDAAGNYIGPRPAPPGTLQLGPGATPMGSGADKSGVLEHTYVKNPPPGPEPLQLPAGKGSEANPHELGPSSSAGMVGGTALESSKSKPFNYEEWQKDPKNAALQDKAINMAKGFSGTMENVASGPSDAIAADIANHLTSAKQALADIGDGISTMGGEGALVQQTQKNIVDALNIGAHKAPELAAMVSKISAPTIAAFETAVKGLLVAAPFIIGASSPSSAKADTATSTKAAPAEEYAPAIKKAYDMYPEIPKGMLEMILNQESSNGTNTKNATKDAGKFGYLMGLTKGTLKDHVEQAKATKKFKAYETDKNGVYLNKGVDTANTPNGAILAAASYLAKRIKNEHLKDGETMSGKFPEVLHVYDKLYKTQKGAVLKPENISSLQKSYTEARAKHLTAPTTTPDLSLEELMKQYDSRKK